MQRGAEDGRWGGKHLAALGTRRSPRLDPPSTAPPPPPPPPPPCSGFYIINGDPDAGCAPCTRPGCALNGGQDCEHCFDWQVRGMLGVQCRRRCARHCRRRCARHCRLPCARHTPLSRLPTRRCPCAPQSRDGDCVDNQWCRTGCEPGFFPKYMGCFLCSEQILVSVGRQREQDPQLHGQGSCAHVTAAEGPHSTLPPTHCAGLRSVRGMRGRASVPRGCRVSSMHPGLQLQGRRHRALRAPEREPLLLMCCVITSRRIRTATPLPSRLDRSGVGARFPAHS